MRISPSTAFLLDIALAAVLFVGIVVYVKKHLRTLLIELCGTTERANFWLAFSNVTLVLVPLIFALDYKPQLKYALVGFVITLCSLALILFRFIPRDKNNLAVGSDARGHG